LKRGSNRIALMTMRSPAGEEFLSLVAQRNHAASSGHTFTLVGGDAVDRPFLARPRPRSRDVVTLDYSGRRTILGGTTGKCARFCDRRIRNSVDTNRR
jgi:hypothetical protein